MALFEEQITDTLETGAPPIKYEGDEGPQDPRQEAMLAQLKEEYMQYVFEMKELDEPVMSFEEWYQSIYKASQMGVQAPEEEMMSEEMMIREPAAYGGIMDTDSGRRMYGLGSIFKKIKKIPSKLIKGVKKIAKSPLGKAALLYAGTAGLGALAGGAAGTGFTKAALTPSGIMSNFGKRKFLSDIGTKLISKGKGSAIKNLAKLGIGAASALPLLGIGTQKEDFPPPMSDQSGKFDFDYGQMIRDVKGAKTTEDLAALNTKYGTDLVEDINVYDYAQGGRIPFALGSKADFAMEDVMTGGMEDEIGGITSIMRQADLQRKGNVGQFYAAQGGRIGYRAGGLGMDEIATEFKRQFGYDMSLANSDVIKEFIKKMKEESGAYDDVPMAHGGRIRAQEGGIMDLGGMEKDYRNTGGFVDLGAEEKADDVPARLSVNEFVMTADAVRGAGDGDIDKGASIMENMMKELEGKGKRFAGGGERGWKAQMRAMEIAEEEYGRDFYDLNDALQHKIYNRALQEIDDMLMGRQGASDMFEVSERLSEVV